MNTVPRFGKTARMRTRSSEEFERDFWSKAEVRGPAECWLWQRGRDGSGYGRVRANGKQTGAHRVAYVLRKGLIPAELEIDHLCRQPLCVNPDHLEAVRHQVNVLRGVSLSAQHARQTVCQNGHPFTAGWGQRVCRQCKAAWYQRNREKRDAENAAWKKRNPEKVAAATAAWAKRNPEKVAAKNVAWAKRNPEKVAEYARRRRERQKLGAGPAGASAS